MEDDLEQSGGGGPVTQNPSLGEDVFPMNSLEESSMGGNELPSGATPADVADDVPIEATEGEYIVPAHIVRFLGIEKLENLISKAQQKLDELEQKGRVGGKTEEKAADQVLPGFAVGGLVQDVNTSARGTTVAQYKGPQGDLITVQFVDGQPVNPIPAGYVRVSTSSDQENTPQTPVQKNTSLIQKNTAKQGFTATQGGTTSGIGSNFNGGGRDNKSLQTTNPLEKDVADWSPDDHLKNVKQQYTDSGRLTGNLMSGLGKGVLGMAGGILGGALGKGIANAQATKTSFANDELTRMAETGMDAYGNTISAAGMQTINEAVATRAAATKRSLAEKAFGNVASNVTGVMSDPVGYATDAATKGLIAGGLSAAKSTTAGQAVANSVDQVKDQVEAAKARAKSTVNSAINSATGGLVNRAESVLNAAAKSKVVDPTTGLTPRDAALAVQDQTQINKAVAAATAKANKSSSVNSLGKDSNGRDVAGDGIATGGRSDHEKNDFGGTDHDGIGTGGLY